MLRMRTSLDLSLCVVAMVFSTSASSAVVHQSQTQRMPVPSDAVLQQKGGMFAASRQHGTHFLSPDASAPVAPHVMTLQDRQVLRQQIQNTASGNLPQPQPASNAFSN